jgi:cytochrome c
MQKNNFAILVGDRAMNGKALYIGILLPVGLFSPASPAYSQSSPPTSETAKQTGALIDKAAALIDSKGQVAFSESRIKGGE